MTDSSTERVVFIDGNELIREAYADAVRNTRDYQVVGTYCRGDRAFHYLCRDKPTIVVLDMEMEVWTGPRTIEQIRRYNPDISCLVNTGVTNPKYVIEAFTAGAAGYLLKSTSTDLLVDSLQQLKEGGAPMSPEIARLVISSLRKNPYSPLSERETEVLGLMAAGKSYSMIADDLFISRDTAKSHIRNIYDKLKVHTKAEAIEKATRERFI